VGDPEDIGDAVLFLVSPASRWIPARHCNIN
jgi:NAD(P)-dependent dehydrogenase (short-subunit alcohol dehydrogenase family)